MTEASVPCLWTGETVVCMASGPSLTSEDAEYCRGKARVVVVNDAVRLAPWADVLYSSDRHWVKFYEGMPSFKGMKFTIRRKSEEDQPAYIRSDGWCVLRNAGEIGLERSPDGLFHGCNSGTAAINLAANTGATRILLLGYDMNGDAPGKSHFFGDHPAKLKHAALPPAFYQYRKILKRVAPKLVAAGIAVINCSRQTALDAFPCQPIEAVL